MKHSIRIFVVLLSLLTATNSLSDVTLPWSTTFNCADWTQTVGHPLPSCDRIDTYNQDTLCSGGGTTQSAVNSAGNYSGGGGGKGWRVAIGAGPNNNAGTPMLYLSPTVPELWLRWYMRYPAGFAWSDFNYHKWVYVNTPSYGGVGVFEPDGRGHIRYYDNFTGISHYGTEGKGWNYLMGGNVGDGKWHYIEMHVKKSTGGSNGVIEGWLDGELVLSQNNINTNGENFSRLDINVNQASPGNGGCVYVDYDDFAISATGYIGPLGGGGAMDNTPPTVPSNLSATAMSSSQINLTWTTSTDNVGVTGYKIYRGGVQVSNSATNSYSDVGLSSSTQYSYTVSAHDVAGNESIQSASASATTLAGAVGVNLLYEPFDNSSFSSRGWYDTTATAASISSVEHYAGTGSFECRFSIGGTNCSAGDPRRYLITPSDELYISYYVKHSTNWIGSGQNYHPHIIYLLGDLESVYAGLAANNLDTYIEEYWAPPGTSGLLRVSVQDAMNIPNGTTNGTSPANRLNTEIRDVGGCSGQLPADTVSYSECYWNGVQYIGDKDYRSGAVFNVGNKNTWHKVDVHLKMNTISGGIAQPDGVAQIWMDNVLVLGKSTIVYRTGQHPTEKWKQVVISPYIGDGSPVLQTMWIDDFIVNTMPTPIIQKQPMPPGGLNLP